MNVVHLTASPFFGGPERQMLGLARTLPATVRSTFLSFAEDGKCQPFLNALHRHDLDAEALTYNRPRLLASVSEIARRLRRLSADVLCCHGYKADLLGLTAARRVGIPVVAVARGWTAATWKVRLYERLDRFALRLMDRVVCVSEGQARKVCQAGVAEARLRIIRNAIDADRFAPRDAAGRAFLQGFFPQPRRTIVGAIGRLSPEKGFPDLIEAAAAVVAADPGAGFLIFGDGPLRDALARQIAARGLEDQVVLAGFRSDLDRWLPSFDLLALPSYTEGLPNVVLEALACAVPVVATAVGGTPEVVADGQNGYLVPAGDVAALTRRLRELLGNETRRQMFGAQGRIGIRARFTFTAQSEQYQQLFAELALLPAAPPIEQRLLAESA